MSDLSARLDLVRSATAGREMLWFGTRGLDARPLYALERPLHVVSQIAPIPEAESGDVRQTCLERSSRMRRDLDRYDIDLDLDPAALEVRAALLDLLDSRAIVLCAYRTGEVLAPYFFCRENVLPSTMFHLSQRPFEYKPWVEQQLLAFNPDIAFMKSRSIKDSDEETLRALLAGGPMVGRTSTGAGGVGVFLIQHVADLRRMPRHSDGFFAVTEYLRDAVPLNINGVAYANGDARSFGLSLQLIGAKGLTNRQFGFCGNDFAAAMELPDDLHERAATLVEHVGIWLSRRGFHGVFGLDFLYHKGRLLISELNARFQASTCLNAMILQSAGLADPYTENIASFVGAAPPPRLTIAAWREAVADCLGSRPVAQVIVRNTDNYPRHYEPPSTPLPKGLSAEAIPEAYVAVEPEAMAYRVMALNAVTTTGYNVSEDVMGVRKLIPPRI